jgi:4-hydroxy-3-methylbut-2-en-1-yl diphosphate reductase
MLIYIDENSGFCYGVEKTIQHAENAIKEGSPVYCLGEIVHNEREVERLQAKGLITIENDDLKKITNAKVLIRAHGVPPETYRQVENNSNELIDGTCPIVLHLQKKVCLSVEEMKGTGGQIIIYGKKGHPEVTGLVGQTNGTAIVVIGIEDLQNVDFSKPIALFAQTTQSKKGFEQIGNYIKERMSHFFPSEPIPLKITDSICRYVLNRGEHIKEFANKYDVVIFVSGTNSSNGKILFDICLKSNPNSHLVSDVNDVKPEWFRNATSAGICSATSTPRWLMEAVAERIKKITGN